VPSAARFLSIVSHYFSFKENISLERENRTRTAAENMATVVARLNDNDPTLERVSLESTKDFHYGELSNALRKSKHVKSFHINEGIFTVEEFKSPTWRHLKQLLQSVAYMRGLEELRVRGNMTLDNMHDVEVIQSYGT
jgi:hypothetical protein